MLVYVDCIIFSRKNSGISDKLIASLKDGKERFDFTDGGDLKIYLGVKIIKRKDANIAIIQPHLIEIFVALVDQEHNINIKTTPATK